MNLLRPGISWHHRCSTEAAFGYVMAARWSRRWPTSALAIALDQAGSVVPPARLLTIFHA
jgi:hypothetical protein